ncbi:MAG TPA: hypothetical protein VNT80_04205 [Acidimicrobiales bacterium]|jgi:hypothetical protein|nr:hypothetical protein [Acidimicrobiales bacterium]
MAKAFRPDVDAPEWKGGHSPYDILKEGTIALVVVALLTIMLAVVFGSPDEPSITIKAWSTNAPMDFATTALSELNGTSTSAQYGAPYNNASTGQQLGPLTLAKWIGVRIPVNTVDNFVIDPLRSLPKQPELTSDLQQWKSASPSTRSGWVKNYSQAAAHMKIVGGQLVVNSTNAGPLPVMMADLLQMARTGALDQALVTQNGFYTTNYTLPLLFLADGTYLSNIAQHQHLTGDQWGMMNETGNYPGQAWLWLYTFWYQVAPFNASGNGDILVWGVMMVLSAGLLFTPFIPGIRTIPRKTRIYRLIWREHYRSLP